MTDNGTNNHRWLLRFQMRVWGLVAGALLVVGLVSGASQLAEHQDTQDQLAGSQQRAHFWRVIAGTEASNTPTVDNKLAKDIRARLGPVDPGSERLPSAITSFRGNSNAYGGITQAIALDPFDESGLNCEECGPLDEETKAKLLLIKQGKVNQVIAAERPASADGYTLTPYGWSAMRTGLTIWLLGGPLALLIAHYWANGQVRDYSVRRFGDLSWKLDGEGDGTKVVVMALAPSFFVPYGTWRTINRRRFESKVRDKFGDQVREVDEIDRVLGLTSLKHAGDPRVQALQSDRDQIMAELESMTRAGESGSIDFMLTRANRQLEEVKVNLQARREYVEENEIPN